MNITFIGGGNMANAIIGGLMKQGQRAPTVRVVEIDAAARARLTEQYAIKTFDRIDAAAVAVDCIVLAIKPQNMREVATALRPHVKQQLVMSIAAGIRGGDLARWLGGYARLVRAMPNTPALVGAGCTGLYAMPGATPEDAARAEAILGAVGTTSESRARRAARCDHRSVRQRAGLRVLFYGGAAGRSGRVLDWRRPPRAVSRCKHSAAPSSSPRRAAEDVATLRRARHVQRRHHGRRARQHGSAAIKAAICARSKPRTRVHANWATSWVKTGTGPVSTMLTRP